MPGGPGANGARVRNTAAEGRPCGLRVLFWSRQDHVVDGQTANEADLALASQGGD